MLPFSETDSSYAEYPSSSLPPSAPLLLTPLTPLTPSSLTLALPPSAREPSSLRSEMVRTEPGPPPPPPPFGHLPPLFRAERP